MKALVPEAGAVRTGKVADKKKMSEDTSRVVILCLNFRWLMTWL